MTNFYVSTKGSDSAVGTSLATAFRTLAKAQEAMRASSGEDTTFVRGGTYVQKTSLKLTEEDAGSHFNAYAKETPHLQGGANLSNWTKQADGVWTAKVSVDDLHQITLNGVRQSEARFPNEVATDVIKGGWLWGNTAQPGLDPKKHLSFDPTDFTKDQLKVGMKIHVVIDAGWGSNVLEIKTLDLKKGVMTFDREAFYDLGAASRFYVADAKVHLDKAGEWWFDTANKLLHYKAPGNFDGKGVVASSSDSIIDIRNTSNVGFTGFTITDSASNDHDNYGETAGINVSNSNNVTLDRNSFANLGKGVRTADDSHHVVITNSTFRHIWSAAVDLNHATHNNTITGNDIRWSNEVIYIGGAIDLKESADNLISGNLVRDITHIGISITNYAPDVRSGNNTIEYNKILHAMRATSDGGSIYTYSFDDRAHLGDIIRHNLIIDSGGLEPDDGGFRPGQQYSNGIYLDDFTSRSQVYGNFVQGTVRGGIYFHGGSDNTAYNNIVIDNKDIGFQFFEIGEAMLRNNVYRNIISATKNADGNTVEANPSFVAPGSFHDNFFLVAAGQNPRFNNLTFSQWRALGFDARSEIIVDSVFVNPRAGDFQLKPGALPLLEGFIDLDWQKMTIFRGGQIVTGTTQADILKGGSGNDILDGLAGDDVLMGGKGADELVGGAGYDTASYAEAASGVTASLANPDLNRGEARGDLYSRINNVRGSKYNDFLSGNNSDNHLLGGNGNDRITGSLGRDTLTGGAGLDTFVFKSAKELAARSSLSDTITDFRAKSDVIDLSGIDANNSMAGNQVFRLLQGHIFDGGKAALRVVLAGNDTVVSADINGDRKADFAIRLVGHLSLDNDNFIL